MTLQELGVRLREAREQRAMAIEDAAIALKISVKVLCALEENDASRLPQPAFVHNFILMYGRYLELPEEDLQEASSTLLQGLYAAPSTPVYGAEGRNFRFPVGLVIVCVFLLALVCGGGYALYANWNVLEKAISKVLQDSPLQGSVQQPLSQQEQIEQEQAEQQQAVQKDAANSQQQSSQLNSDTAMLEAAGTTGKQGEGEGGASVQTSETPVTQQAVSEPATQPSMTPAEAHSGNRLTITGISKCWIRYKADKEKAVEYVLKKGGTVALSFTETLEIQFGNVSGVRLIYNDKELPKIVHNGRYSMSFPLKEQ